MGDLPGIQTLCCRFFCFVCRLIVIILLALGNRNSLEIDVKYVWALAAIITPFVVYLFYSVKKYFTMEGAFGIDYFDTGYNEPYVKQGIFKYTDNGMFVFGLVILNLPGLIYLSEAALLAAVFNHVYIRVHYCFTGLPNMQVIYGKNPY